MKEYFIQRKTHLKECELDYYKKHMDKNRSFIERNSHLAAYRELHARRSELEYLEEYLEKKGKTILSLLTGINTEKIANHLYNLNLQNLNSRLTENEAFLEGIKVGIDNLLESTRSQIMQYFQKE